MIDVRQAVHETIEQAAKKAAHMGCAVTVKVSLGSFFPSERTTIEVTVTPSKKS